MTGRDVAIACMLGAEEFGFATAPLVAMGCCMMRACHLDTCPAGIATQNPSCAGALPATGACDEFYDLCGPGTAEYMARLGIQSVDELVGRSDLLQVREHLVTHRAETLDLSALLCNPFGPKVPHFDPGAVYDFHLEQTVDMRCCCSGWKGVWAGSGPDGWSSLVSSTDRALGTLFGSEITRRCGDSLARTAT